MGDACPRLATLRYTCDDPDDCTRLGFPGTVCCGTIASEGTEDYLARTQCVLRENCAGMNDVERCDPSVPGQCRTTEACVDLTRFPPDAGASFPVVPPFKACLRR